MVRQTQKGPKSAIPLELSAYLPQSYLVLQCDFAFLSREVSVAQLLKLPGLTLLALLNRKDLAVLDPGDLLNSLGPGDVNY